MRVANFNIHSCIRAHKMAFCGIKNGHEEVLVTTSLVDLHPWFLYNAAIQVWREPMKDAEFAHFERVLGWLKDKVDIFHCHNEPDWLVPVVKRVCPEMPVVYDIHDMRSLRDGTIDEWEATALSGCDAVLVPSRRYKEIVQERRPGVPVEEVLSCVPEDMFPKERCKVYQGGLVYEGGLKPMTGGSDIDFAWRSWTDVFKTILEQGTAVWAYRANLAHDFTEYNNIGVMLMGPIRYDRMLQNLTAHEAGIVGSPFPDPAFDGSLPNKLFEYIAAGLPVISLNSPTTTEFLVATGLGIGVESPEDIPEALEIIRRDNYRDEVWKMRWNWTMDKQWPKIESIYKRAMGLRRVK